MYSEVWFCLKGGAYSMCFSAEASFIASACLGAAGIVALKVNKEPGQVLLAVIPLIFSVQQFAEGMLWLSFSHPDLQGGRQFFTYSFLVISLMVWPVWMPFSVWFSEREKKRKKALFYLLISGLGVAAMMACLLIFFPVQANAGNHHIHYEFDIDKALTRRVSFLYFIPAIIPPFLASNRKVSLLGFCLIGSYVYAALNYPMFFVSVYCYFAALMSIVLVWIVATSAKPLKNA